MRSYSPVDFTRVSLNGPFWAERLETVLTRTVPSQYEKLGESGILESLELKNPPPPLRIPRMGGPDGHTHQVFWDSDIGKWIEAAGYALRHRRDPDLEAKVDAIVARLAEVQMPDGYLNLWYQGHEIEKRWTNLRDRHELYNAGHLLEGAIAYYQATGKRQLLDVLERYLDHIRTVFGTGPGQKRGYDGHQEIELALVKLYRLTGERKQLDLASYFIDQRGAEPHYFDQEAVARGADPKDFHFYNSGNHQYSQSHKPVREQDKVVGHAVRAMYMYSAMADLAAELDDPSLRHACEVLWRDVTTTRMYVTGGFGPSASNEGFTTDYDLPNDTAYCETCASIAFVFWAQRMLNLDLDGHYAELMELALYNGVLSGLSRDGTNYFYENKLDSDGSHRRWPWHPCPCCTMNVSRLVASVGGYFYSVGPDTIAINLYGGNSATLELDGRRIRIEESSLYPLSGKIQISVHPDGHGPFTLKLRIPAWAGDAFANLNGNPVDVPGQTENGYLTITRDWIEGDVIDLDLPMPPRRIYANPKVKMDRGRVALARGPLVYCAEQVDNSAPVPDLVLPRDAAIGEKLRPDLFDGVMTLVAEARNLAGDDWGNDLYRTSPPTPPPTTLTAIPYYLWANREPGPMQVWLRES